MSKGAHAYSVMAANDTLLRPCIIGQQWYLRLSVSPWLEYSNTIVKQEDVYLYWPLTRRSDWTVLGDRRMKEGNNPLSIADNCSLKKFQNATAFVNVRYHVRLLWKEDEPRLPKNRILFCLKKANGTAWATPSKAVRKRGNGCKYREVVNHYI